MTQLADLLLHTVDYSRINNLGLYAEPLASVCVKQQFVPATSGVSRAFSVLRQNAQTEAGVREGGGA